MNSNQTFPHQTCFFMTFDEHQIQNSRIIYTIAAVLDTVFILPSVVLNSLLIRTLGMSPSLKKPSTLLLYNLSISNLLIGAVLQPVYLTKKIAEFSSNFELYCKTGIFSYVAGFILASASCFTLTAIAVDRYCIVHWGMQYPLRVTKNRLRFTIVLIWLLSFILSTGQFYMPRSLTFPAAGIGLAICTVITTASYIRILTTLRKRKIGVQKLNEGTLAYHSSNVERYGKSAITMLFVYVAFLLCYLPYLCTMVIGSVLGESFTGIASAESIVTTITYLKSTINPLILFWRIKEVQKVARKILLGTTAVNNTNNAVITLQTGVSTAVNT